MCYFLNKLLKQICLYALYLIHRAKLYAKGTLISISISSSSSSSSSNSSSRVVVVVVVLAVVAVVVVVVVVLVIVVVAAVAVLVNVVVRVLVVVVVVVEEVGLLREFLTSASHQLVPITCLFCVHTARRSYRPEPLLRHSVLWDRVVPVIVVVTVILVVVLVVASGLHAHYADALKDRVCNHAWNGR